MNYYLLISGLLMVITGVAHSVIGEMKIISPIQRSADLPAVRGSVRLTKLTLRFAWHVTSVLGFGIAAILIYYSKLTSFGPDHIFIIQTLSITFFISFLVSVIGSRAKHPAWIVFIITAVLTWLSVPS